MTNQKIKRLKILLKQKGISQKEIDLVEKEIVIYLGDLQSKTKFELSLSLKKFFEARR